jgi:hypothetical protein
MEQIASRIQVVAADKGWGTMKYVEFARNARGLNTSKWNR